MLDFLIFVERGDDIFVEELCEMLEFFECKECLVVDFYLCGYMIVGLFCVFYFVVRVCVFYK